ncbi:MAG: hypothetical protein ACREOU_15205 [Candidatus Eiseniibacteriota bacterium]
MTRLRFAPLVLGGAAAILFAAVTPSRAVASEWGKGTTVLALQAFQGGTDFLYPGATLSSSSVVARNEIGGQFQIWRYVSDRWAVCFSLAGTFSDQKLTIPPPVGGESKTSSHTLRLRGGLDRMVRLDDAFVLFAGAGLEYATTEAEGEAVGPGFPRPESKADRFAFSGRMGSHIRLGSKIGLVGQIGYYAGYATADHNGLEARWWPSGTDAAGGLTWSFGGPGGDQ